MHPKSKKKAIAINTGLLAYTFTKLGDNLANNDRFIYSLASQTRRKTYSPFNKHAKWAKLLDKTDAKLFKLVQRPEHCLHHHSNPSLSSLTQDN